MQNHREKNNNFILSIIAHGKINAPSLLFRKSHVINFTVMIKFEDFFFGSISPKKAGSTRGIRDKHRATIILSEETVAKLVVVDFDRHNIV